MNQATELDQVDRYAMLDLSAHRAELLAGAESEAGLASIELSGEYDRGMASAGLTPHAAQWFNQRIVPVRAEALSQISSEARAIRVDGDDIGSFEPFELDAAERERAVRLREATAEFAQKNASLMNDYRDRDRDYRRHRSTEGNREAKVYSYWLEFAGLLPLVMIPEALMNFQSFRQAPMIQSDFMALGVTLLVAIGIAVGAHFFGLFLRQYNYFGRGADRVRARSSMPQLYIALVLLLVGMAVVAGARYYYIVPQIQQAAVLGVAPPNVFFSVASLLGGNLLCFLLGAAFAWILHDENPEYEDAARALKKLRKQMDKAKRATLDRSVRDINKRLASDRDTIQKKARTMRAQPGYSQLVSRLERIKGKDQEVASALQEYRQKLGRALEAQGRGFEFSIREYSGDPMRISQRLSISEFMNHPLRFPYEQH